MEDCLWNILCIIFHWHGVRNLQIQWIKTHICGCDGAIFLVPKYISILIVRFWNRQKSPFNFLDGKTFKWILDYLDDFILICHASQTQTVEIKLSASMDKYSSFKELNKHGQHFWLKLNINMYNRSYLFVHNNQ